MENVLQKLITLNLFKDNVAKVITCVLSGGPLGAFNVC